MSWRPDDWEKSKNKLCQTICGEDYSGLWAGCTKCQQRMALEEIADAMLSALITWLFEPCDKHPFCKNDDSEATIFEYRHKHRYGCPSCMAEIEEKANESIPT